MEEKKYRVSRLRMSSYFTPSPKPLSSDEKSELLSKFEGDLIVYFEDYAEPLCAGPDDEHKVNLKLDFSGRNIEVRFLFSALQSSNDNCTFIKDMFLAIQNASSAVIINN